MSLSWLPNLITVLRIVLLIPLTIYLNNECYREALILFFIAGFSDALDGYLAKRFGWISRFGAIMDPLADKALLVITMAILTLSGHIMWQLFILVAFRDLYIVCGAMYYHYRVGPYQLAPSKLSKLNTFIQLLLITSILVSLGLTNISPIFIDGLVVVTFITTITSGIHYTWVWGRKLKQALTKP